MEADPHGSTPDHHAVVGVYRTSDDAQEVAERLTASGVADTAVRVETSRDGLSQAFEAQVDDTETVKKAAISTVVLALPITLACAILALPFAFFEFGGADLWVRMVWCAVVGAAVGVTLASIVGPAVGARRARAGLDWQRSATVRVSAWSPELVELMASADPIRLEVVERDTTTFGEPSRVSDLSDGPGRVREAGQDMTGPGHDSSPGRSTHGQRPH